MTKRKAQELQEISVEKNGEDVKVSGLPDHICVGFARCFVFCVWDFGAGFGRCLCIVVLEGLT